MSVREFVGARYVPIVVGEWDNTRAYEPLMVVTYQGASYTSRQYVPAGIEITNTDYWVETANYNAQVEQYRKEVLACNNQIMSLETKTSSLETRTSSLETRNSSLETRTSSLETKTSSLETRTSSLETRNSSLETRTSSLETRTNNLEITTNYVFDTVASMKESSVLSAGNIVKTLGYAKAGKGGAYYIIASSGTANEMDVIALKDSLYAVMVKTDTVSIAQLGAIESTAGSDANLNDIANVLTYALANWGDIVIDEGVWYLAGLTYTSQGTALKSIRGINRPTILSSNGLNFAGTEGGSYSDRIGYVTIKNIRFTGVTQTKEEASGTGVTFNWFNNCNVKDCEFMFLSLGLKYSNGSEAWVDRCVALGCNKGMYFYRSAFSTADLAAMGVNDCACSNCTYPVYIENVRDLAFNGCSFAGANGHVVYMTKSNNLKNMIVKFNNCSFENTATSPALEVNAGTCIVDKCIAVSLHTEQPIFEINYADQFTCTNTQFGFTQANIIVIDATCPETAMFHIDDTTEGILEGVIDNRDIPLVLTPEFDPKYHLINFYPDMSRSILEFITNVQPTAADGKSVTFGNATYIEFPIDFIEEYIYVVVRSSAKCTPAYRVGSTLTPMNNLNNGANTYTSGIKKQTSKGSLRITIPAGTTIYGVYIYSTGFRRELPYVTENNVTSSLQYGVPAKGDLVAADYPSSAPLYVWDGDSWNALGSS